MKIRNYEKGDIYQLILNGLDQYTMSYVREDVLMGGTAFTGIDDEGNIVGSAGLTELWEGVYEAWIALDERFKRNHLYILRHLKDSLETLPSYVKRVHAHVNVNTENQQKLMRLLGFEAEAILKNFFPKQSDCVVYRRLY